MAKKKEVEMIEKSICIDNRGIISGRELYLPNCDVSFMISCLWRGPRKRSHFLFEDLLVLDTHGWKIYYIGKKSIKLPLLNSEYLGEKEPIISFHVEENE